jgi:hypothetical protein
LWLLLYDHYQQLKVLHCQSTVWYFFNMYLYESVFIDSFLLMTGRGNQVASKKRKWWWEIELHSMETFNAGRLQTSIPSKRKTGENVDLVCVCGAEEWAEVHRHYKYTTIKSRLYWTFWNCILRKNPSVTKTLKFTMWFGSSHGFKNKLWRHESTVRPQYTLSFQTRVIQIKYYGSINIHVTFICFICREQIYKHLLESSQTKEVVFWNFNIGPT